MRTDVPVRELAVLARNESVELHRADQCIDASSARRIAIEPVLEHPLVGVSVGPHLQAVRALPADRFVIGCEYRRRSWDGARKVVNERQFGYHLRRVASRRG